MQKKLLLCVMAFNCVAQAIVTGGERNAQHDRFANLREDLRALRNDPDNARYANVMVDGVDAIEKAKKEKLEAIEQNRAERKNKVSSNRGYWGSEAEGTIVYNEDKKIDDELNAYVKEHERCTDTYKAFTLFMHSDLSNNAQKSLAGKIDSFKTMERALQECRLGDQACYDQHGAPLYNKMADLNYRRTIQEYHYTVALKAAHEKGIPVTDSELRVIIQKNVAYSLTVAEIEALNNSIDDLVNPEKIKEREAKKIKDLENQKKKEEQDKLQALADQLKSDNK